MKPKQYLNYYTLELTNSNRYDTSLMIPEKYVNILRNKANFHGGLRKFLHYLIMNFSLNLEVKSRHVLTKYQDKGQFLIKRNFKPESRDWNVLRSMANHTGLSISRLFIMLLEIELRILGKGEKKSEYIPGIPVKFPIFKSFSKIKFKKNRQYLLVSRFKFG